MEEELGWARLERQRILALSAEADDAIWHLATVARRRMQERDEARNQARMLLADLQLQARTARMMAALPGTSSCSRVQSQSGYKHNQALAPEFRPLGGTMMQGQRARAGTGYCVASSSGFGSHRSIASSLDAYALQPSLHGLASSSQDHFDPDMFLVDVTEPPQDVVPVPATADSGQGRSSGSSTYGSTSRRPCSGIVHGHAP